MRQLDQNKGFFNLKRFYIRRYIRYSITSLWKWWLENSDMFKAHSSLCGNTGLLSDNLAARRNRTRLEFCPAYKQECQGKFLGPNYVPEQLREPAQVYQSSLCLRWVLVSRLRHANVLDQPAIYLSALALEESRIDLDRIQSLGCSRMFRHCIHRPQSTSDDCLA